ncbi:PEGA domain-containing protein [Polyangium jinanense]|uniref:PEGA domain-containing protein n=1 Tax=Polyangium jinanense TaxID=2829994 RepID=A0A9X3XCC8_9BACT|nr:PEGA domain-containing protein [Polyangium jinanense]MDC3962509.1 PEGA domain-containing protein [Polyangium jinanense]MDC3986073.1 PEGA domain-containing protein [Polyangium jinanense]
MIPRRFVSSLVLAATLLCQGLAHAQSPADVAAARDLFRDGAKLAQEGRWAEARERYMRSLALKRAPLTLYSLGVANREIGRLVEALESFRAFLVEADLQNAANKPYEQPARDAIIALEKRVGRLDIRIAPAAPPALSVRVDGAEVPQAALGVPRIVDPGEHTIVVRAQGYREATTKAKVGEGEQTAVTVTLVRIAPKGPGPGPGPVKPPGGGTPPIVPEKPVAPIFLLAGGAVAFASGLTVGLIGVQKASDAPVQDGPEAALARRLALAGDIVGSAGILAAGAGLAMLLLGKPPDPPAESSESSEVSVQPFVTPTGFGLVGRF